MWRVAGQESLISHLERILKKGLMPHALLITGPSRTGRKLLAYDIARALNCEGSTMLCDDCPGCMRIKHAKHADVQLVDLINPRGDQESKKTAIGVAEVEAMQHSASLGPFEGRSKVFIIDGAELLSASAANRLLKTLEEPPPNVCFVLIAQLAGEVMPTVASRCQHFELKPVSSQKVYQILVNKFEVAEEKAELLAPLSHGRLGWAIEVACDENLLEEFFKTRREMLDIITADYSVRFEYAESMAGRFSRDRLGVQEELSLWLVLIRDLLFAGFGLDNYTVNRDILDELKSLSAGFSVEDLRGFLASINQTREYLKRNVNPRLALEVMMLPLKPSREVAFS